MSKIIFIDARVLSMNICGIGIFCYNVLNAFAKYSSNIKFLVCTNRDINKDYCDLYNLKNVEIIISPLPILKNLGVLWFLIKIPYLLYKYKPNIFWSPATLLPLFIPTKTKTLITVHDVVLQEFSNTMSFSNRLYNKVFINRSINKANHIWAVSNYTKNKIKEYYPHRISENIFVGSSINLDFYKPLNLSNNEKSKYLSKYGKTTNMRFLLFVGTLEPRKNLKFLLSLMPILAKKNYKLIIVGGKGWGNTNIATIINSPNFPKENVYFTGYVNDSELRLLYNCVDCFVSASLNEGFGLPQLEAIACNCPVISPNNSAMSEVVGEAGILINGWDVNDWTKKIEWSINNKDELLRKYPSKIQKYKWENIIKRLILDFIN